MNIGIIEYDMGNIQSVANAFEYLSQNVKIVTSPNELKNIDKIVLPGVGAFGEGIEKLKSRGFIYALNEEIIIKKKWFLGICLGMQLICRESFEFGLGWINAGVIRFNENLKLRVPHVGWNNLNIVKENMLIKADNENDPDVYFVHSFYVNAADEDFTVATTDYGIEFTSMIEKENIFATQFHPEKSQKTGLEILKNFASL